MLRDLIQYSQLLAEDGFMMLNDCVNSQSGFRQNLGVLGALHQFNMRTASYDIIAQTSSAFADVLLGRRDSKYIEQFGLHLKDSKLQFIEIPSELCYNSMYVDGRMRYLI